MRPCGLPHGTPAPRPFPALESHHQGSFRASPDAAVSASCLTGSCFSGTWVLVRAKPVPLNPISPALLSFYLFL